MRCPKCGTAGQEGAVFCKHDGTKLVSEHQHIPVSERKESAPIDRGLYRVMGWFGFTSGIGLIGIGGWWFIFCLINYLSMKPDSAIQQVYVEQHFMEAQLGVVLIGLGVIVMTIKTVGEDIVRSLDGLGVMTMALKKVGEDTGKKLDRVSDKESQPNE
jgi:hypothetical protein